MDELEREKDERQKREKEIRERKERERRKREELDAKMMESGIQRKERFKDKEWKMMGGLGANVGTEDWNYKKSMQEKMKVSLPYLEIFDRHQKNKFRQN